LAFFLDETNDGFEMRSNLFREFPRGPFHRREVNFFGTLINDLSGTWNQCLPPNTSLGVSFGFDLKNIHIAATSFGLFRWTWCGLNQNSI